MRKRMTMKKVLLLITAIMMFIIVLGAIFYEIVLPEMIGKQYISNLYASAQKVRNDFETLAGRTDTPLLNNPTGPIENRNVGTKMLKQSIADSRRDLEQLRQASAALQPLPYSGYTSTYGQAVALKERSERAIVQATDTLNDFDKTLKFLETYTITLDNTKAAIDTFNKTTDLNTLIGQSAAMRETAATIQKDTDDLKNNTTPNDFTAVKTAAIQTLSQASAGFNQLADALDTGSEIQIDQAAKTIEAAGLQLATKDRSSYVDVVFQSRSVHAIFELNEKLDLILP